MPHDDPVRDRTAPDRVADDRPAAGGVTVHIRQLFNPKALHGEVAVVTGGGSGIGYAIARDFLACGAEVVITSRSADRLAVAEARLASETGQSGGSVPCDVRDEADVERLHDYVAARYGQATIVVNNAAANFRMRAERMTFRALDTVVNTDLFGTFHVTRSFVPAMLEAGHGVILNITLPRPEFGFPWFAHCGAAKAAIVSLTATWAYEWGRHGIRVNAIAPGPVPTDGVAANMLHAERTPAFEQVAGSMPLGRLGTPADIAAAAVFLCSPAASWITGQNLVVDGGIYLNGAFAPPAS
ncbi:SDR family oxidoreductase [Plantactinospora mayteni]|uniref:Peroxisomal trans-2-enoyl-CoA reductase n=1 Tax=Plantactinospora mayteni TaxID=566021 RepID=A0ABQ4EIB1_9ACTN|nr:SDR family oxidoreductase [Plantactinospora mayteni]GIG94462.1 oxidoreductase [Plantactinospora mayteni]